MTSLSETIDPHARHPASLPSLAASMWRNRRLLAQLVRREVAGRYKGSVLGLAWSFFNPVLMLLVYTFVFSEIFKVRWGDAAGAGSKAEFAILLFAGMTLFGMVSEVMGRAPMLIAANANYVKKVVFPLEILPLVTVGVALFHGFVSLAVLMGAVLLFNGMLPWTVICLPLVILPLVIMAAGLGWLLASLGVFLRDIGQSISFITTVLTFLSPVFYPVSAVPEEFRWFIHMNPLTFIIEQGRDVLIWGKVPDWGNLMLYIVATLVFAWASYAWFQRTRKGFADVL